MNKQIYDFENDLTKKVKVEAFNTQNIELDADLLNKQRYQQPLDLPFQTKPQRPVVREKQETIVIEDSLDDEFEAIMDKTKSTAIDYSEKDGKEQRKVNWTAIGFGVVALLLSAALIFVSMRYFATVAENTKMNSIVAEAEEIKRNNNSQINTLTKQKEDIDTKLKDAQKERETLQKKLTTAETDAATKTKDLETLKTESQKKIDELQKKVDELQKQIDAIKKVTGAQ